METSETASSYSVYSDCDCYLCQFGINCQELEPNPFYGTVRHPLVYFAQCRHGRKRDCRECKRPNCFIRAFRWYTNEHGSPRQKGKPCQVSEPCKDPCEDDCNDDRDTCSNAQNICSNEPNMSSFAMWLDSKYQQFMMENATADACCLQLTQTSVMETCHPDEAYQPQSGTCGKKRFSRVKNHWKRRIQKFHERESCDKERNQAANQSMEYIMPPKNLSRAASECCHPTPICSVDRHVAKSQSATATVCLIKSGYDNQEFDKPPMEQKHTKNKGKVLDHTKNVSCQCAAPAGQNAQTQYETPGVSSNPITPPSPGASTQVRRKWINKTFAIHKSSKTSSKTNLGNESNVTYNSNNRSRASETNNSEVSCQFPPNTDVKIQKPSQVICEKASNLTGPCQSVDPCSGLRPSEQTSQSRFDMQVQYPEFNPNDVQRPCPDFQRPCPSLPGTPSIFPDPCPSLKESCFGRKPCPSFRKPCPPCPTSSQQYRQTAGPKVESQLQYQQPYPDRREQVPQSKYDSQTQHPISLRDCCTANAPTQRNLHDCCAAREHGPTFVEPFPKVRETPLRQEEFSYKTCAAEQVPQSRFNLKTQYPDIKPNLHDCCTASAPTQQGPNFVEPSTRVFDSSSKQQEVSYKSYTGVQTPQSRFDSKTQTYVRDCCTASSVQREQGPTFVEPMPKIRGTPLNQEEFSFKSRAVNTGYQEQCCGPNTPVSVLRETSIGVATCSDTKNQGKPGTIYVQDMQTYFNQHQASLECRCFNCYPSEITYDRSVCCRRNEFLPPPTHQNVIISTSTGEGKCSVNCPYYANISKGQTTTTQTVQFTQSESNRNQTDGTAQTSNTAIRLDRGTIQEYPLFMRVVCADKLQ